MSAAAQRPGPARGLDRFLPVWDVRERHSIEIAASPARVAAAMREVTPREAPLIVVLMGLRGLPGLLRSGPGALRDGRDLGLDRPLLEEFGRIGFVVLADEEREVVLGVVGAFWKPTGNIRRVSAEEFVDAALPGVAKGALDMTVAERGAVTVLATETRVICPDAAARRRFLRYWRVIRPGSAAIRHAWLRAIRKRALR